MKQQINGFRYGVQMGIVATLTLGVWASGVASTSSGLWVDFNSALGSETETPHRYDSILGRRRGWKEIKASYSAAG